MIKVKGTVNVMISWAEFLRALNEAEKLLVKQRMPADANRRIQRRLFGETCLSLEATGFAAARGAVPFNVGTLRQ